MSRSIWAATGACALALATMPGVARAEGSGSSPHVHGGKTPAAAIRHLGRRHPHHIENRVERRRRRPAGHAGHRTGHGDGHALVPGTGYQQAAGSGRVRSLQRRLAHLAFAPGPIDGRYGPRTTSAVRRLQAAAGLTVDGIAGPRTLAMVDGMRHAVLAPGAGYHRRGGSGRVRTLQRRLARLGFAPGPIDGRYGPRTTKAIRRFQRTHHLPVSGVIGVRTWVALKTTRDHLPVAGDQAPALGGVTRRTPPPLPTVSVARAPVVGRPQEGTPLPVGLVLLALAALGLAAATQSYWTTRRRLQERHAGSTSPPGAAGMGGDRRPEQEAAREGSGGGDSRTGGAPPKLGRRADVANSRGGAR